MSSLITQTTELPLFERQFSTADIGGPPSFAELTERAHQQLRAMAEQHLRRRFGNAAQASTWQPTALVNETFLRLIKQRQQCDSYSHFFALATTIMKRVLIDYARERRAKKRGGGILKLRFAPGVHDPVSEESDVEPDLEALFLALDNLEALDGRKADVARMRILWALNIEETATSIGVSRATVERDWRFAQAWLRRELMSGWPGTV